MLDSLKNLPILFIKNVPQELLMSIGIRFWFAYYLMLGKAIINGKGAPALRGYLKGVKLFWTVALPSRKIVQHTKKVRVSYIKNLLWPDLPPEQIGLRKLRRIFTGK